MRRSSRFVAVSLACLGLGLTLSACRRHGGSTGDTIAGTTPPPPIDLAPLPDEPVIKVDPESLPGADGTLAVVTARPKGEARGNFRPTITFSKPVVALGTLSSDAAQKTPVTMTPSIPGEWRWLGSTSIEFVPKGLVPYATEFTVTVPAGLAAIDGAKMVNDYTFKFTTPKPEVQSATPKEGWRWMKPDDGFTLIFNQPVADLLTHTKLTVNGASWPLTLQKEVDVAQELRDSEKGDRRYDRQDFSSAGFKNRQTRYELAAGKPLPLDASVELAVSADLAGKDGPLTLGSEWQRAWRTYGPMKIASVEPCGEKGIPCAWGPLVVFASNRPDVDSWKGHVSIQPKVDVDWDHAQSGTDWNGEDGPYLTLPGNYRPGTSYTAKIDAGVKDEFAQAAPASSGTAATTDLVPRFDPGAEEALLESAGDGALPVESANIASLDVKLWQMTPAQMAMWMSTEHSLYASEDVPDDAVPRQLPLSTPITTTASLVDKKNVVSTRPVQIRDLLPSKGGLFVARLYSPLPPERYNRIRLIEGQITDLAVHAKLGATSGIVWVTRLSDGKPVAGASIALWDSGGAQKWTGTTDADGLVKVPGLSPLIGGSESRWDVPYAMVSATKDGDTGVTLSRWTGEYAEEMPSDWDGKKPKSLGFVAAERGIYRPGDTVYFEGLARYRELGKILAPGAGSTLDLKVTDSQSKEQLDQKVVVDEFGTFHASFDVPKDAPLGGWEISATGTLSAGGAVAYSGSFRVEEYRAPQFKVDVTSATSDVVAGDPIAATVMARYLFGGAMPEAPVKWSVERTSTSFTTTGNPGFAFGQNVWGWDDEEPSPSSGVFASGDGKTDVMGVLQVDAGKSEAPGDKPWSYTLEAEVADVSRQRIANRVAMTVHPASYYAGVRPRTAGFPEAGKEVPIEVIAVDLKGQRVDGVKVDVAIVQREWKFIRKKGVGDRWFTETQKVDTNVASCTVTSAKTPQECTFTPKQPGIYLIDATATDEKGRHSGTSEEMYVIGSGWVDWQRTDTDRLDLVADQTSYDVGQTAKILVKSPYPEADALLTVEREGVLLSRRVHLKGAAQTLEVPIDESLIPNAFVSVVLVRGRVAEKDGLEVGDDPGRPAVRIGYLELHVEKKSKRLSVVVTPDAPQKRPRDKVTVNLAVTDWQGKGVASELAVWAVDEGVLRLTSYEVPDPIAAVHPDRGLSVRVGESLLHLVLRKKYSEKGENTGGSGGDDSTGADVRRDFKTTVLFSPSVKTDATGHASVSFDLPDNLTTFRIMAMAVTKEDRFGTGTSQVEVSKPLLAMPALPRLARVGDAFEAGVVVHSPGAKVAKVDVKAETTGLVLDGPATATVAMDDGKPHEVRFKFKATDPGTATLRFRVSGGGESDAVEQKIPVQLPVGMEAVAVYGDTKDDRLEAFVPPSAVRPDVGGLDVTLTSTVLGGFDENMRQLVDYPYGCLEQMTSRLIPFVELRKLHSKFGLAWTPPDGAKLDATKDEDAMIHAWLGGDTLGSIYGTNDPDEVIRTTIKAIEKLQNHDGGFRYWADTECSDEWTSAYAVLVLKRTKDVGFPVDDGVLSRGQTFLSDTVAAGKCTRCGWGCWPPNDATRVNALYALARTGKPKASYYPELFARRDKLPLFAQAMLADAMFVGGGDRTQARQLFQELLNHAKESPKEVHFEENDPLTYAQEFSSDPRTTAIVLQTLTDVAPDHPYVSKIASYLTTVRKGDGRFRNTQEAAFALMALSEVVATKEKDVPDYTATVTLGKQLLTSEAFHGRTMDVRKDHLDMSKLAALGLGSSQVPFDFKKVGAGVLYYGALLRYAPAQMPMDALDRGLVVQRWFEPYAGGGQVHTVRAGELVRIRVRVATHMERNYVAIDVPLPSGLEAVDTSLASTAQLPTANGEEAKSGYDYESAEDTYSEGGGEDDENSDEEGEGMETFSAYQAGFWSPFNHVEQRDDRVVLFADTLPPGVHVASFVARATTPGDFVLKPASAEEMYTPEVFGRSEGGTFHVVESNEVSQR